MDTSLNNDRINKYRNDIILYIVNNSTSKYPIKVSDIVEKVFDKRRKDFNYCFSLARTALMEDYGILLKDVPDSKTGKKFICYSSICAKSTSEYDKEQKRQITLLFIVLSYIFMVDNAVYESQLENFLAGLKIYFDTEHEFFGSNVKKLITDTFVRQLYLNKVKSDSELDMEIKYTYDVGFRGNVEFKKEDLLRETAKILGKPPKYFIVQYNKSKEDEEDSDDCSDNDSDSESDD